VNVRDWREAGAEVLAPLYASAHRRWLDALGWDTAGNWRTLEEARTTWGLPGLLAVDDDGQVRGWTFFLPRENVLHVGGLVADTPDATAALLEAVVGIGSMSGADGVSCFMFEEAPGVAAAVDHLGFETEPFLYLTRPIAPGPGHEILQATAWQEGDVEQAADLLHAAYTADAARYLAPGHTSAAWQHYVRTLVEQTGLGTFAPQMTRVLRSAPGGNTARIDALAAVTILSPGTVHLAQVAVHPSKRGQGIARALVTAACGLAAAEGFTRATLLVGATNRAALRMYRGMGFEQRATFVAGVLESRIANH
jgi:ribosomal protein S18 acetylase RimI-like enzyme